MEELTSLKCPHYPKQSIDSTQFYKDSNDTFYRTRTNISKIEWNYKRPCIATMILRKKNEVGENTLSNMKLYYNAVAIKTA